MKQERNKLFPCTNQERFNGGRNVYKPIDMAVVDGTADEIVPEQHRHLEAGLLGRHVRRHGRPERPSPKNHHLRKAENRPTPSQPLQTRSCNTKEVKRPGPAREPDLARGLEDVAAVAAAPGAGPPDQLLPRDAHRAAAVLARAPARRGGGVTVVVAGVLVVRRRHDIGGAREDGKRATGGGGGKTGPRSWEGNGREEGGGAGDGAGGHWNGESRRVQFCAASFCYLIRSRLLRFALCFSFFFFF